MRIFISNVCIGALLVVGLGCKSHGPDRTFRADKQVWADGQRAYLTNDLRTAYQALLKLNRDLSDMEVAGHKNLDYVYCRAVVYGQLFVAAERLGDSAAADTFFQQSAGYWEQDQKSAHMPPREFTRAEVRSLAAAWDAKVGPALWRQSSNSVEHIQHGTDSTK